MSRRLARIGGALRRANDWIDNSFVGDVIGVLAIFGALWCALLFTGGL